MRRPLPRPSRAGEKRARPAPAQTGTGPRAAALDARCKQAVRETGLSMRVPPRRVREALPAYGRRVARATASIARVYRKLYRRLKDLPGSQQYELFRNHVTTLQHARPPVWPRAWFPSGSRRPGVLLCRIQSGPRRARRHAAPLSATSERRSPRRRALPESRRGDTRPADRAEGDGQTPATPAASSPQPSGRSDPRARPSASTVAGIPGTRC